MFFMLTNREHLMIADLMEEMRATRKDIKEFKAALILELNDFKNALVRATIVNPPQPTK
jgi:hypothetical protein